LLQEATEAGALAASWKKKAIEAAHKAREMSHMLLCYVTSWHAALCCAVLRCAALC